MKEDAPSSAVRIGELASVHGINPKTIRYYEEIGLMPAPERDGSGCRLYGEDHRAILAFILRAKTLGLSLEEIAEIVAIRREGGRPCARVSELVEQKLQLLNDEISRLECLRRRLERLQQASGGDEPQAAVCSVIERAGEDPPLDRGPLPAFFLKRAKRV